MVAVKTILEVLRRLLSKNTLIVICVILLFMFGSYVNNLIAKNKEQQIEIERLESNISVYKGAITYENIEKQTLRLTIDELKKDTTELVSKIKQYQKELKVKDRELRNVIYTKTVLEAKVEEKLDSTEFHKLKTDLTIEKIIKPNDLTSIHITLKDSLLGVQLDAQDKLYIYHYQKMLWREPNFWKRLFLFRWSKKADNRYNLKNENSLIKITETQYITIEE